VDFGGFICFGLGLLVLIVLVIVVLSMFVIRSPARFKGLSALLVWLALMGLAARFLYQVYYLNERLVFAAMQGNTAEVKLFLAKGAEPESTWENGETALEFARKSGNQETIDALLAAGAKR
jgi:hypothetical protein